MQMTVERGRAVTYYNNRIVPLLPSCEDSWVDSAAGSTQQLGRLNSCFIIRSEHTLPPLCIPLTVMEAAGLWRLYI